MEACLSAVQKGLLLLLAASVAIAVVTWPEHGNRRLVGALEEVTAFRTGFMKDAAEQALRLHAEAQGEQSLKVVEPSQRGKRTSKLKVTVEARPIKPLSAVSLATLADVAAHAQPRSTVTIGVPNPDALSASLVWRFARAQQDVTGPFVVRAAELLPGAVTAADVELEREVTKLRVASLAARAELEDAERKVQAGEWRVEAQSKRRSKNLYKSRLALDEARSLFAQKMDAHTQAQLAYDAAAQRAEHPRAAANVAGVPTVAIARVKVRHGSEERTYDIPVPLAHWRVPVPELNVTSFQATRAAGLWDDVKGKDAKGAIEIIESRFNWHLRGVGVWGMELSGARVLEFLPCVLPWLLWLLLVRMRRAETSYSPFRTQVPKSMPRVGFDNRALEFIALVLFPAFAVACAGASLVFINRPFAIPAMTAILCVILGGRAFSRVREVRDQTISIMRSHSYPPPPPAL